MQLAHRVILVCNMGCIPETQSIASLLCDRDPNSVIPKRRPTSVSIVLNSAKKEQFYIAQDKMSPFEIINMIPPIEAFKPESSMTGEIYLSSAPKQTQKAVINRCGIMLTKIGYESFRKYFSVKSNLTTKSSGDKSAWSKFIRRFTGDK